MMDLFRESANTLYNESIRAWKEGGGKVVGYTCSYLPGEIIHAAGLLPCRIRGHAAAQTTVADGYFGPFICSLAKCMLQLAGEDEYSFLDGAVIIPGCDSMRRLDECWRRADADKPGVRPPFFFHFGVPHKHTDYSVTWFTAEAQRFIEALESHFSVKVSGDALSGSVALFNETRRLMARLESLRCAGEPRITGADALAAALAASVMPPERFNEALAKTLEDLEKAAPALAGRKRIMLVGSASDDVEFVRLIEGERAVVVADTLCFGARSCAGEAREGGDPLESLAGLYLSRNYCPRMYGQYEARIGRVRDIVREARVDGVVLQNIRFCDLHGSENGLMERDLEAGGTPCLRIEREYGPLTERGRLKMRIDAFLERLS